MSTSTARSECRPPRRSSRIVAAGLGVAALSLTLRTITCRAVSQETVAKQLYICTSCGFIYDPEEGDPDGGIPPGTAFADIPDTWFCPVCGARKADFEPFED